MPADSTGSQPLGANHRGKGLSANGRHLFCSGGSDRHLGRSISVPKFEPEFGSALCRWQRFVLAGCARIGSLNLWFSVNRLLPILPDSRCDRSIQLTPLGRSLLEIFPVGHSIGEAILQSRKEFSHHAEKSDVNHAPDGKSLE